MIQTRKYGQEMALFKVPTKQVTEKMVVERLLREYEHRFWQSERFYRFQTTGHKEEETEKLIKVFENYGLIEFVRSARIAIIKKVKVSQKLKNLRQKEPGEEVQENEFL